MALIVFLRGINVGGHRTFRPSMLARELGAHDVVNVGAAGTLVVRKPGTQAKLLAALRRKLPFEAEVAFGNGRDLIRLEMEHPFGAEPSHPDVVRFVSILSKADRGSVSLPMALPGTGEWFVRILGSQNRLLFGMYRRHMKTISYLSQIDELFGAPATTRSWSTILSVVRILKATIWQTPELARRGVKEGKDDRLLQPGTTMVTGRVNRVGGLRAGPSAERQKHGQSENCSMGLGWCDHPGSHLKRSHRSPRRGSQKTFQTFGLTLMSFTTRASAEKKFGKRVVLGMPA
jgi:uncharacterized protein (DUF1697 family)